MGGTVTTYNSGLHTGVIDQGNTWDIMGSALTSDVTVEGSLSAFSGGTTEGSQVQLGTESVLSGGTALYSNVIDGHQVVAGGLTFMTTIGQDATQLVKAGTADLTVVLSGGVEIVSAGSTTSTIVSSGGYEIVSGGSTTGTVVSSGGNEIVSRGSTTGTVISSGGNEVVSGGSTLSTIISSGGNEVVYGGTTTATVVSNGGHQYVEGGTVSGTIVSGGGTQTIFSGGSAVASTVNGILVVDGGSASTISLGTGGVIDLAELTNMSGGTVSLNTATDVLAIVEGGVTSSLQLAGDYGGLYFHLAADLSAYGGTDISDDSVPCYVAGTLIATTEGETSVEDLAIGSVIITASGRHRPIRWIGRRSYAGHFLRANPNVHPVRFHAGSLADGLPRRDLLVSPEHAMFLDGMLIPARALVNDRTITQQDHNRDRVDYFHIELDSHDLLLAEGAPSESFVDDFSRGLFQNAAEWAAMYPQWARTPAGFCAPRVEGGYEIETVRQRLADIAEKLAKAA